MCRPRELLAYGSITLIITFVLYYGVDSRSRSYRSWTVTGTVQGSRYSLEQYTATSSHPSIPDFSRYEPLGELNANEFPIEDPTRNIVIVGDIHGMIRPFRKLLRIVDYSPSRDVLIHVGDVITKGPLQGSLDVLKYLSTHNITGVRGNHDQQVVEWRGWFDWITSLPGGQRWLVRLEQKWEETWSQNGTADLDLWIAKERCESGSKEQKWWKRIPDGWRPFSDHYKIAKAMSKRDFRYLLNLPLRLYVPSAHVFIVHGGLLPSNPKYPPDDKKRQPLARIPTFSGHWVEIDSALKDQGDKYTKDIDTLRNLQEVGLLNEVPQNLNPWAVLNMRSVLDGEVIKGSKKGTPWTKLWTMQMNSCVGYKRRGASVGGSDARNADLHARVKEGKHYRLPCYPSTTIYGHAASRGLDIKRWTFGLDTGCVYGKKLSALVIKGDGGNLSTPVETDFHDDGEEIDEGEDEDQDKVVTFKDDKSLKFPRKGSLIVPFGDNAEATIVNVKCRR